ncbi:SRPBCC family protein [Streptomyces sp. NPDC091406]|uniref:SRPBCC family protein n=1 Tax=unclassified Streptomyces TaxID=2593676 RepID=UPI0038046C90
MTVRTLQARTVLDSENIFRKLQRQEDFSSFSPDIISVVPSCDDHALWKLAFRGGVVSWTQQDDIQPDRMRIAFKQVEGDFIAFKGSWSVFPEPGSCRVVYDVEFRTSVAHLAGAVDPVVGRVLLRSAAAILHACADPIELLSGAEILDDLHSMPRTNPAAG